MIRQTLSHIRVLRMLKKSFVAVLALPPLLPLYMPLISALIRQVGPLKGRYFLERTCSIFGIVPIIGTLSIDDEWDDDDE